MSSKGEKGLMEIATHSGKGVRFGGYIRCLKN